MGDLPLAYCGIDCNKCPVFISTTTDDKNAIIDFAKKVYDRYGGDFDKHKRMRCLGCAVGSKIKPEYCDICEVRNCAVSKKYSTCAECDRYDYCMILKKQFENALQPTKENLDIIRNKQQLLNKSL